MRRWPPSEYGCCPRPPLSELSFQSEMLRIYAAEVGEMFFTSGIDELKITSADEMAFLPEHLAQV